MASFFHNTFITLCVILLLTLTRASNGDTSQLSLHMDTDDVMGMSMYDDVEEFSGVDEDEDMSLAGRRNLLWRSMRYYISYGALSANRIPCPPRSGRSYYTHNCWRARGPVHPYTRGCSTIARCRR